MAGLKMSILRWKRTVRVIVRQSAAAVGETHTDGRMQEGSVVLNCVAGIALITRMWANAQRDGRPANIGGALCSTPQSWDDAHY